MPKYKVTLREVVTYELTVEADSEEAAPDVAEEAFVQSPTPLPIVSIDERVAIDVTAVDDEEAEARRAELNILHPPAQGRAGLEQLAALLRDYTAHAGFSWDFEKYLDRTDCGHVGCAIGFAQYVWGDDAFGVKKYRAIRVAAGAAEAANVFGIDYETATGLFSPRELSEREFQQVRPEHVAEAIEQYLRTGNVPDYTEIVGFRA